MSANPMSDQVELMLALLRPEASKTPAALLPQSFETILMAYARLAVEYLPPAEVARLLRDIADAINERTT